MRDRTLHDGPFAPAVRALNAGRKARSNEGDELLRDMLLARRNLRYAQVTGLQHLDRAIGYSMTGNDTACWMELLEAMAKGDDVAEIRAKVFTLQQQARLMFPRGVSQLASEILLMGVNEWMW